MEEADRFCDRVAIMDRGQILALDAPSRLKRSCGAGAVVTMRADGDQDGLARLLTTVPGVLDVKWVDTSVRVLFESAEGALPRVLGAVERGDFKISDLAMSEDSLETVFINLTGRDLRE
jgi:ABC-2 type transport system ATP-binding protein